MIFSENGNVITIEMSREDYNELLFLLGVAAGSFPRDSQNKFWRSIDFVNRINAGNPGFTPYQIPDAYRP